jgi:putative peptidoglycan lipid II flippase
LKLTAPKQETRNILLVTLFFTLGTAIGKVLGFANQITLGSYFGTSYTVDAYVMALNIPTIIFSGITGAFAFSFIPIFMELKGKDPARAYRFMNNFINIVLLIFIIPLILIEVEPQWFIRLFAHGFSQKTAFLSASLLQLLFPTVFFTFMNDIFNAYLNSLQKFKVSSIQWVVLNGITLLVFFILVKTLGIYSLVVGVIIGNIVQAIIAVQASKKEGYRFQPTLNINDPFIKTMFLLSIPAFITSISIQINLLVDRSLVSGLAEGSIAALNYAQKLYFIPLGLVSAPVLTVMYPKFVEFVNQNEWDKFKKMIESNIKLILFMFIPVFVYFIFFAQEIVKLVYNYGAFGQKAVSMTGVALACYALASIMQPIKDLLDRLMFSLKLNKLIMYASIFSMIINVILCFLLIRPLGIAGAALSTSISSACTVAILSLSLIKFLRGKASSSMHFSLFIVKTGLASLISLYLSKLCLHFVSDSKITILLAIGFGALLYLIITYILRIDEFQQVLLLIRKRKDNG